MKEMHSEIRRETGRERVARIVTHPVARVAEIVGGGELFACVALPNQSVLLTGVAAGVFLTGILGPIVGDAIRGRQNVR